VRRHQDWDSTGFGLSPVAEATGPFPRAEFLALTATPTTDIFEHDSGLAVLSIEDNRVVFGGEADLTDYHAPLGDGVDRLFAEIAGQVGPGFAFDLDSLPLEAAEPVAKGLEMAGLSAGIEQHSVAAVLALPDTFEGYLEAIGKKQRHEVRRKRRRYEETVGELHYESHHADGYAFDEFVRLHRRSTGSKGRFMTPEHEEFFRCLIATPGWRLDILRIPESERAAACLFVFVDETGMYLYNSAYDPDLAEASPGVAILGAAIEQAITERLPRFDFLKGDEIYKFRLGASERPLFRVTASS
jgi:CelD/BcsL family acetyltransferase involved in cellulose biosynthesis